MAITAVVAALAALGVSSRAMTDERGLAMVVAATAASVFMPMAAAILVVAVTRSRRVTDVALLVPLLLSVVALVVSLRP